MNSVELREARAKAIHDARNIIDRADAEKRELTGEENAEVDLYFGEADRLEAKINTQEKRDAIERAESSLKESKRKTIAQLAPQTQDTNFSEGLRSWLLNGTKGFRMTAEKIDNAARCGIDLNGGLEINKRAMNTTDDSGSVQWKEFYNGFAEELKSYSPVLGLISYHNSVAGVTLPIPVLDDTSNKAAILGEASPSTAADPGLTHVNLGAFKYESKEIILSLELLQDSSVDLEAYVSKAIADRFARAWAEHVTTGVGTTAPYGLATRAANSSVVATGTTGTPTFTTDMMLDLADSLDDAYMAGPGVGYMTHPTTWGKIRKLKSTVDGNYLWQPSLVAGQPATFNGFPCYRNMNMATSGASAKLMLFGDFSKYIWRNVGGIEIYRLNEYRILNGQISFQAFARGDGNLILPNSVKYLAGPAS